jgi:replicative superfamily II helicase
MQDCLDFVSWTYLYRRVQMNPTYYGCENILTVPEHLSKLIEKTINDLEDSYCVEIVEDFHLSCTPYGKIASHYYLKYSTMKTLKQRMLQYYELKDFHWLVRILCDVAEFDELPVRHNEGMYLIKCF